MSEFRPTLESKRKFSLNWGYLGAMASGRSAIDLGALALRNLHDAREFVREYGYDLDQPAARDIIRACHREAVDFIVGTFLQPGQERLIPREVHVPGDPVELLVHASHHGQQNSELRMWSCAILKVMHAIFYIDNNLELRHFNTIREQVFATLDEVIHEDDEGHFFLSDGELCLPLHHLERKRNKGRNSILLKLLQKPAYLAQDIYDHLGVRLVFNTRFECLLALETLQRAHILSITNIEPNRTRNTLLDLEAAKEIFVKYRPMLERSHDYPAELLQKMDAELQAVARRLTRADNPHSGEDFSSIQVTVRKMIHLQAEQGVPETAGQHYDVGFFFDYEVQLMDKDSHQRSMTGPSSHEAYKRRQVETARLRVFGRELSDWIVARSSPAAESASRAGA
ncbi:TIGR04552 family protein [[Empedobacter] haloabium]|uniref:TIGR04552 family protein n=1 Tax=[Empedobacter] haloabium TaxID=592317 RepID=A0ABZ1UFS2_9BURK